MSEVDHRVEPYLIDLSAPGTAEEPFAFTFREFVQGAFGAWGWFLLLAVPALLGWILLSANVTGDTAGFAAYVAIIAVIFGVPVVVLPASLGALVVGSPLAWLLSWTLRRVDRVLAHVAAFTAYGAVLGIAMSWATLTVLALTSGVGPQAAAPLITASPFIVASAVAVDRGRYRAIRRAMPAATARATRILDAPPED